MKDVRYVAKTDRGTNTLGDGTNLGYIEILNQDNAFLLCLKICMICVMKGAV